MAEQSQGKLSGGMRIIEGLQYGIHLDEVFRDIARDQTPYGVEMYVGAVESLLWQLQALRRAGLPTTHQDKEVNDFLQRPPVAMTAEMNRLMLGGEATRELYGKVIGAMTSIVWQRRMNFLHPATGKLLAIK